jgi:hypothetical protein
MNMLAKMFVIFSRFRKIEISKLSKNIEKITLNSNFGNCEKLVPTRKLTRKFEFKFGMQGLTVPVYMRTELVCLQI